MIQILLATLLLATRVSAQTGTTGSGTTAAPDTATPTSAVTTAPDTAVPTSSVTTAPDTPVPTASVTSAVTTALPTTSAVTTALPTTSAVTTALPTTSGATTGCAQYSTESTCDASRVCFWSELTTVCESKPLPPGKNEPGTLDCEVYTTPQQCHGKVDEGDTETCYWDFGEGKCAQAEIGDAELTCVQQKSETACQGYSFCSWHSNHLVCYFNNGEYGEGVGTELAGEYGCNDHPTEAECATARQDGEYCRWDPHTQPQKCTSDYQAEVDNPDCESHLTETDCAGKTHDGKTCYWHAVDNECEEGDLYEHECEQHGTPESCGQATSCTWEESECKEFSTLLQNQHTQTTNTEDSSYKYLWATGLGGFAAGLLAAVAFRRCSRPTVQKQQQDLYMDRLI